MLRLGREVRLGVLHLGEALLRLGKALLRLGEEVCLGEALLHLGGSESSETQASGSPRCGFLLLGGDICLGERSYA